MNVDPMRHLEQAGVDALTLSEGLSAKEFLSSRVTRYEVAKQVLSMAKILNDVEPALRNELPEVDWSAWEMLTRRIHNRDDGSDDALWFCVQSLVPATIMWLRHYRATRAEPSPAR